jgi:hypothetical protein
MKFIKDLFTSACFEIAGASGLLVVICAVNVFVYEGSKEILYLGIVSLIVFLTAVFCLNGKGTKRK